ncbi:GNAT family N-acetyltransferase [Streptomyces sp. NPDC003077]|uniref:GNAT family N-acetyltransferase n=1 Tax=Streptomyces sp. NPDC003077 TaxID=3154443 RepID=UPI0033AFC115
MEPVTLTTERLLLRPHVPSDAPAVYAACQDPEIPRWTNVPSPYGMADAEEFVGRISPEGWRTDTSYNFAVIGRADGALVGSMGLIRMTPPGSPEHQAELGYWTAKEHRGKGLTAEAARAVARWALVDLGVERLEWLAEAGNEGSRAVAQKTGFHMEGVLRSKLLHQGTRRDAWIGSLLPSDLPEADAGAGSPYLPYPG